MTCKVCGQAGQHQTHQVREMMFGYREWFTYLECSNCGCLQIAEIPADLSKYYPASYYSFTRLPVAKDHGRAYRLMKKIRDCYAIRGRGLLGKWLYQKFPNEPLRSLAGVKDLKKDARILDVGCGSGALLWDLRNLGFGNTLGVDPFLERDFEFANGLRILKRPFFEVDGTWDLIMFHHVLEHLADPVETLRHTARLLSAHGTCLIRTPTVSSYAWEHYGTNWVQLDAPRHLFVHSIKSIEILASRVELEIENISYDSNAFQFWGSEQILRDIPLTSEQSYAVNPSASIFEAAQMKVFKKEAKDLNLSKRGDMAAFYLRKA
ncbi:class I SAM-dependent methyltransferase [candidate division KSB1 bacterium]|nr:class I SAM-dependent methyltransferase [candidate division KSB1 bacterium]